MWWMLYYGLPILVTFIVVYRLDLSGLRVLMLSWLPTFLFGLFGFVKILLNEKWELDMIFAPLYLSMMSYAVVFPALLITALIVIVCQKFYTLNLWQSVFIGGVSGMISMYVVELVISQNLRYSNISGVVLGMVLGALSTGIMYYFIERRGIENVEA